MDISKVYGSIVYERRDFVYRHGSIGTVAEIRLLHLIDGNSGYVFSELININDSLDLEVKDELKNLHEKFHRDRNLGETVLSGSDNLGQVLGVIVGEIEKIIINDSNIKGSLKMFGKPG